MIGVSGGRLVGKSTFATIVSQRYGLQQCAFADKLKSMCMNTFKLSHSQMEDPLDKEAEIYPPIQFSLEAIQSLHRHISSVPVYSSLSEEEFIENNCQYLNRFFSTPREILQFIGTDIIRAQISPDFHIHALESATKHVPVSQIIVTDCRFPNEREYIKKKEGILVLILDPNKPCYKTTHDTHASEMNMGNPEDYDIVIRNNKFLGLPHFIKQVHEVMDPYLENYLDDEINFDWK